MCAEQVLPPGKMYSGQLLYSFYIMHLHGLCHLVGAIPQSLICHLGVFCTYCLPSFGIITLSKPYRGKVSFCSLLVVCFLIEKIVRSSSFFFFFLPSQNHSNVIKHNCFAFMINNYLLDSSLVKDILSPDRKEEKPSFYTEAFA